MPEDTVDLARTLLGTLMVSEAAEGRSALRIVETEAYLPGDPAAHSYRGETARNRTLFMRRGHAYVYFIYGAYYCLNVSSERAGVGAGVLIRAGEPWIGTDLMQRRRLGASLQALCRGPGRLANALAVTRLHDGLDLTAPGPLWLAAAPLPPRETGMSTRIGLTREADRILRFYERGNSFVSGAKRQNA